MVNPGWLIAGGLLAVALLVFRKTVLENIRILLGLGSKASYNAGYNTGRVVKSISQSRQNRIYQDELIRERARRDANLNK